MPILNVNCDECPVHRKSIFRGIDACDMLDLSLKKTCYFYRKGQMIFYEGKGALGIYCVNQGKIKIFKLGPEGKEQIIRVVLPGEVMGLRSVVSGRPYSASATALDDSVCCFISKRKFFQLTIKYPEISQRIMILLSQLLDGAENKITSLAQKSVRERLAETLLSLDEAFKSEKCNDGGIISLSREDLANLVGTATETVIRLLSEFKHDELVEIRGRKIKVLNKKELLKIGKAYYA
ncbi:MAG: Crp/Fnr family transcriptional regulator [Bacteroidales bacterium]|nr:Crp/Fnr family transcriptional regulator [Bacteroidales bacterium]